MPDLESRMPDLLRRAAGGSPHDPRLDQRVLRRARRRRVLNASVAGLAVVALVVGIVVGVRELAPADHTTPGDPSPTVVAAQDYLDAIWPEVTVGALAAAQASVDDGHQPWRTDAVQTAAAFAVNVFDWDPNDVETRPMHGPPGADAVRVIVSNHGLASPLLEPPQPAPETVVSLRKLGTQGEAGVWSVIRADTELIQLDPVAFPQGRAIFEGRLVDTISEWTPAVWPMDAAGIRTDGNRGSTRGSDDTFRVWTEIPEDLLPATGTSVVGILVGLWDPEGTIVGGDAFPFTVGPESGSVSGASGATGLTGATGVTGASGPTGASGVVAGPGSITPEALATHGLLLPAASKLDLDALEGLIDPNHFAYNFDDGSNPVPLWREDPAPLDTLAMILQMPFTTNRDAYPDVDPSSPTVYIWPSLMASDLATPTPEERVMLDALGISEREAQDMLEQFGGYVGPRTGISEDGTWVFYAEGGD